MDRKKEEELRRGHRAVGRTRAWEVRERKACHSHPPTPGRGKRSDRIMVYNCAEGKEWLTVMIEYIPRQPYSRSREHEKKIKEK